MPTLTSSQEQKLRAEKHKITTYLSALQPRTLWTARVNSATVEQGDTSIPFDTGSGDSFGAVEEYQEVFVGTTVGGDELGRVRIRSVSSGDAGVTGTLVAARSPVVWQDDAYLTFVHDYPLRPLRPRIATDETFYKDYDVAFSWPPPPVCIAGPHRADFLQGASLIYDINLSASYPVADGATVDSYAASVFPASGTTISLNTSTGIGDIAFTQTGQYWVKYSCTDSNAKTQTTYRCYFVASTDPSSPDYPFVDVEVSEISGAWQSGGWDCTFSMNNSPSLADIPDRTLAILWGVWEYGGVSGSVGFGDDYDSSIIVGYIRQDSYSMDMGTGERPVRFKMTTAQGVLAQKYNYSVSLEAVQGTPDEWWKYDATLTVGKGIHHLLAEHTTAMECMDVFGLTNVVTKRAFVEITDNNIYGATDGLASQRGTREHLICDRLGRSHFVPDPQLLPDADRALLATTADVTVTDRQIIDIDREQENQSCYTHVSGFVWDGTFDADGAPDAQPVCAIAPGDDPYEDGPRVERLEYQTFASQQEANDVAGRVQSAANNRYKSIEIQFHGNYLGSVEPAYGDQWKLSLLSTETPRQIVLTDLPIYPRVIQGSILDGAMSVTVTFEGQAPPLAGKTTSCPTLPPLDGIYFPPVEDDLAGALITAGSVYYKSPLQNSWVSRYVGAVSDLAVDPYWNAKQSSTASVDAIAIIGGVGYLRRTTDAGQNWSVVTPGTDPPNSLGDDPAPTAGTVDYAIIEPNETVQSEWVAIARWQNGNGDWRSWILYTDDDFATTSWSATNSGSAGPYTVTEDDAKLTEGTEDDGIRIVTLNATDFVVFWSSLEGLGASVKARVGRNGSGGVVFGDPVTVSIVNSFNSKIDAYHGTAMSETVFMLTYLYETASGFETDVVACSVDDLEISQVGTPSSIPGVSSGGYIKLIGLTPTKSIFVTAHRPISALPLGFTGYDAIVVNIDGADIDSFGTLFNAVPGEEITAIDAFALSPTALFVSYGIRVGFTDFHTVHAHVLSVSGDTITENPSDDAPISGDGGPSLSCCQTGALGALVCTPVFVTTGYEIAAWHCSIVGTAVSFDLESTLVSEAVGNTLPLATAFTDDLSIISYLSGSSTKTVEVITVQTNPLGTIVTIHENILSIEVPVSNNEPYIGVVSGKIAVAYVDPPSGVTGPLKLHMQGVPGLGKALGASISRATGLFLYITGWDGFETFLQIFEMPALNQIDDIYLSTTTEDELNSKQSIAFPFAPWGFSDGVVWIYGRMQDPAGLSGLNHVIYSLDGGLTFTTLEDSQGSFHCSSLAERYGEVHAIFSSLTQSKLYTGNLSGLSLVSTLPIAGFVQPHGTAYNFIERILYVASAVSGAVIVVESHYPYSAWADITYDHGVAAVNAIAIL